MRRAVGCVARLHAILRRLWVLRLLLWLLLRILPGVLRIRRCVLGRQWGSVRLRLRRGLRRGDVGFGRRCGRGHRLLGRRRLVGCGRLRRGLRLVFQGLSRIARDRVCLGCNGMGASAGLEEYTGQGVARCER